ncbi:MAG: DUF2066 domain-containing protein [Pseudomonadota bacterium]
MRLLGHSLLILLTASLPAWADTVEDLHRGTVAVEDLGEAQLAAGTRQALAQVLVKVSGHRETLQRPAVKAALADGTRYMQRYRYLRDDLPAGERLNLQVYFDAESINALLRESAAPLWTANRPELLLWLMVDDGGGRQIATAETHPELYKTIEASMERRGVPLAFPLLDLEDLRSLTSDALWRMDELDVYRAAQRYGQENVLVGRLTALPGNRWMGDWTYLYRQTSFTGSIYGQPAIAVTSTISDFVADRMGERYAVAAGLQVESLLVRIDSVESYADYQTLLDVFSDVELVSDAWMAYREDDSAVFRLTAQADAVALGSILSLDRRLEPLASPPALRRGPVHLDLHYRWQP